jgi:hypothetical protein
MALTSRLLPVGDYQVTNQFDEYTLQNSSYAASFNGSQYLSTPNSNAFALTGNFTIECWAYFNNFSDYRTVIGMYPNGAYSGEWLFQHITGTNKMGFYVTTVGSITSGPTTLSTNTWYHIAMVRSGTTITAYINGVSQGTLTSSATIGYNNGPLYIGAPQNIGTARMNGFISNVRIVNGTALYTSAFTPPLSPLTAISNTSFLTCQNPTIIDNSTNALTITNNGTAVTTNFASSVFYNGSGSFNGSSQWLNFTGNTSMQLSSGDFTIECFFYLTGYAGNSSGYYQGNIINNCNNSNGMEFELYGSATTWDGVTFYAKNSGGTVTTNVSTAFSFSLRTWYHIAAVKSGSTLTIYVNGTAITSGSSGAWNEGTGWNIGSLRTTGYFYYFPGFISNLRVVKGSALYTRAFIPPTSKLSAVSGTSLLTLQSPTIIDNSTNAFTITNNGSVVVQSSPNFVQTKSKQFSDGTIQMFNDIDEYTLPNSVYATQFNGSNQNLLISGSTALDFAGGDFTIECWIYVPSGAHTSSSGMIINRAGGLNIAWAEYEIYVNNGGIYWAASLNNTGYDIGGENATGYIGAYTNNTWTHIAITRSGNVYKGFVNGTQGYTQTITGSLYAAGTARGLAIGSNYVTTWGVNANISTPYNGYISNLRIVKGTALYTSNFTPSIFPLIAIPNTQLLTCQNPTIIDNSTNAFTITNNNTAITTYVPSKFYTASFNGSNQYLTAAANAGFSFGTGDFTVECWIRTPAFTNTYGRIIVDARPISTNGPYWIFGLGNTGIPVFYPLVTGTFIGGSTSVATNTWVHLAATRSSGTLRLFVNGVSAATPITGNVDDVSSSGSGFRIGLNAHASVGGFAAETLWNGNISNLRVVKGTALYTADFTPPTIQLTAVSGTSLLTFNSPTIIDNSGNGISLTNNGTVITQSPASFIQTKSRLFSDGVLQVANSFDEYTISVLNIDYLVAAGGGGGAGWGLNVGGAGGGAGGLLTGSTTLSKSTTYTVVIGSGGATAGRDASGGNGSDSSFTGTGISVTSKGGGRGGFWNNEAGNGGSGGGSTGGAGTVAGKGVYPGSSYLDAPRQGYDGALGSGNLGYTASTGGGGGGAGGAGSGSTGGAGVASSISGTSVTYCAGGSGGSYSSASPGSAALGCGGRGATGNNSEYGGSGVVIIRFPNSFPDPSSTTGSPTVTNTGGYKIYQWTSSGSITF